MKERCGKSRNDAYIKLEAVQAEVMKVINRYFNEQHLRVAQRSEQVGEVLRTMSLDLERYLSDQSYVLTQNSKSLPHGALFKVVAEDSSMSIVQIVMGASHCYLLMRTSHRHCT